MPSAHRNYCEGLALHLLPEDILREILARLPTEAIIAFSAACKYFRALVQEYMKARMTLINFRRGNGVEVNRGAWPSRHQQANKIVAFSLRAQRTPNGCPRPVFDPAFTRTIALRAILKHLFVHLFDEEEPCRLAYYLGGRRLWIDPTEDEDKSVLILDNPRISFWMKAPIYSTKDDLNRPEIWDRVIHAINNTRASKIIMSMDLHFPLVVKILNCMPLLDELELQRPEKFTQAFPQIKILGFDRVKCEDIKKIISFFPNIEVLRLSLFNPAGNFSTKSVRQFNILYHGISAHRRLRAVVITGDSYPFYEGNLARSRKLWRRRAKIANLFVGSGGLDWWKAQFGHIFEKITELRMA